MNALEIGAVGLFGLLVGSFLNVVIYRVPRGNTPLRFAWGHEVFGWDELRRAGLEQNGSLIIY